MVSGCATVLVLTAAGVGYGIYSFVQGVEHGSNTCLPSDFPRYPGAVNGGFSFELNGSYPGTTCHVTLESSDDVASVTAFYQSKLNAGNWQVTSSDEQADLLTFQRARRDAPFGKVQVAAKDSGAEITVDVYTNTCLPLGFPKYPGARFGGQSAEVGATRACHVVFVSNDSVAAVTGFYEKALNTGEWQVTSSTGGEISFRLRNGQRTVASGTVTIGLSSDRTEIKVDSSP
ncbi:MAG TPA: hypothetical protein VGV88_10960 [Candidatus Dormibacteraeota bacterium]|nr:hypothetical protein [Candidatus Dormibacteraeota bacterium]